MDETEVKDQISVAWESFAAHRAVTTASERTAFLIGYESGRREMYHKMTRARRDEPRCGKCGDIVSSFAHVMDIEKQRQWRAIGADTAICHSFEYVPVEGFVIRA